jgi:Na+/alanine symporter
MNKKQLVQTIGIFVVFTISGLLMILVPYQVDLDQALLEATLQSSLPLIGSAMIAAGLVFFLLEMTRLDRNNIN